MTSSPPDSFVLQIERGRTAFPERPINAERFLIGAGSNCHLQLGGDFPILHSIVIPRGPDLWIDAVVPNPALIVNGRPVRESVLEQGDIIEIGEFVFTVGKREPTESEVNELPDDLSNIAELSAGELVERLEAEMTFVEDQEAAREQGAAALLQAAAGSGEERVLMEEREATIRQLLVELQQRADELNHRERLLNEHARQLEQTQRQIREQLRAIESHLATDSTEADPALRLTA